MNDTLDAGRFRFMTPTLPVIIKRTGATRVQRNLGWNIDTSELDQNQRLHINLDHCASVGTEATTRHAVEHMSPAAYVPNIYATPYRSSHQRSHCIRRYHVIITACFTSPSDPAIIYEGLWAQFEKRSRCHCMCVVPFSYFLVRYGLRHQPILNTCTWIWMGRDRGGKGGRGWRARC